MSRVAVSYNASNDIVDILSVSMISVLYSTKNTVDFYIIDLGINEPNKGILIHTLEQFENFGCVKFAVADIDKEFANFPRWKWTLLDTYARILIPKLFPELTRCVYLDSDTIALGDIMELFDYDLGEFSLGAVPDLWWRGYGDDKISLDNVKFSSGVLLIDCEKWRKASITNELINLGMKYADDMAKSGLCDMFLLNLYFKNNEYKILPERYGFMDIIIAGVPEQYGLTEEEIETEAQNCVIRHLSGKAKPWISNKKQFGSGKVRNFEDWWFFANKSPFLELIKAKLMRNNVNKTSENGLSNFEAQILAKVFKHKFHIYKLIQFFTLGLVKKFLKRKEYYRAKYKEILCRMGVQ